eukprot:g2299.t1
MRRVRRSLSPADGFPIPALRWGSYIAESNGENAPGNPTATTSSATTRKKSRFPEAGGANASKVSATNTNVTNKERDHLLLSRKPILPSEVDVLQFTEVVEIEKSQENGCGYAGRQQSYSVPWTRAHFEYASTMLFVADFYSVLILKAQCEVALMNIINVENVVELLTLADRFGANRLKTRCLLFSHKSREVFSRVTKSEAFGGLCKELILELLREG